MPSLKIIKKRISSVKSTQKITRAMKLVSAAKLRRAQERAQQSRPFEEQLLQMVGAALNDAKWSSALTEVRDVKKACFVVFSSDRGLAGSLNSNIFKSVLRRIQELQGTEIEIVALGRKAFDFFRKRGFKIHSHHIDLNRQGTHQKLAEISKELRSAFVAKTFDCVEVFYPRFVSAMTQKPVNYELLPFRSLKKEESGRYIYEPKPQKLLDSLVPMLIDFQLYRFMLENTASEHAARMAAMESATKNSKEMIERLTLEKNRARQAIITKELMEIIGGAEAISA